MSNEAKKRTKTREERFLEVAPVRVIRVIKAIESLQKCSSRNYEYTDSQVNKMMKAIKESIRICEISFKNNGKNGSKTFTF
jgi:hypothetical protein|tara:strand:+ start:1650 stop:1892 length:243 start_codon:yes stop_codon:yes gene_type:complete